MPGSLVPIRAKMVDKDGHITPEWSRYLVALEGKTGQTLTPSGQINDTTQVVGRSEGLGTTIQNLTPTGELNTDNLIDGTGLPISGGKRGQIALDTNNRLADSFRSNAVNNSYGPTSATVLSNDGVSTSITVAASSNRFGPAAVSYNSGSVDPGSFGTFAVNADDPTFSGGVVTYTSTTVLSQQVANDGRVKFGAIKTTGGTPQTGGGVSGGSTPGGNGGDGVNLADGSFT